MPIYPSTGFRSARADLWAKRLQFDLWDFHTYDGGETTYIEVTSLGLGLFGLDASKIVHGGIRA